MSVREHWDNLSPNAKQAAVIGGALLVVGALTAGSFLFEPPRSTGSQGQSPRDALVRNILTDADPRQMGMEALVNRLERMEKRMAELRQQMDSDARRAPQAPAPSNAERDQAMSRAAEVKSLQQEVAQLRAALSAAQAVKPPSEPPGVLASPSPPAVAAAPVRAAPVGRGSVPLEELFGPPAPTPVTPGLAPIPEPGRQAASRTLQIRTVAAPESPKPDTTVKAEEDAVYVPAGAILTGVLLNGLDMPTGQGARKDPMPALIRVKHQAILPNRVRADVRECFLLVSGFGDLAAERAQLRGETFSCVRSDGGVVEIPMDGYAVGEDGKVGVRGRVVSKQGAMLAKALQAGFLQSFSQLFNRLPAIPVSTGNGADAQFQSLLTPQAMGAAAAQGAGGAMDRLANYYMDMAEQMFPVIEVDAGRGVEFILNKGTSLPLAK